MRDLHAVPGVLLICLDLQRANLREGSAHGPGNRAAACEQLLAFARRAGWSIVHSHRVHDHEDVEDTPIPGLEPLPSEAVFLRQEASALSNPRLTEIVRSAREGCVLIAGLDLRTSGVATALDAFNRGVRVTLVRDALWAAPREGAEGASEQALWEVLAPFAGSITVARVCAHAAIPLRVANDAETRPWSTFVASAKKFPAPEGHAESPEFIAAVADLSRPNRALIARICRRLEAVQSAHGAEVAEAAIERVIRALECEGGGYLS